ncbi:MAG: shikimate dehydrogenase [Helicobacter sp.]|nr:shikimate dehydrogenase [Helicobacteraceae bacterium]MDY3114062.1 shikimate dehydrogenase [Helicobacter sp.]
MQFAVIGNPISHSLSPILHNHAFKTLKIPAFYGRFQLSKEASFYSLRSLHLKGANITVPFKETAFNSCDETFGIAQKIKTVNTIIFKDSKILGYNTDAQGFFDCLDFTPKDALIIGAGGSAKAVAHILKENNINTKIINRSKDRLKDFSEFSTATFSEFDNLRESYDLVINTTPAGLVDSTLPLESSILEPLLKEAKLAFDLIYGKNTPFLNLAKSLNTPFMDGKQMLINQAILAFLIFTESQNIQVDKEILKKSMQNIL